jgi:hypothetical protein
MNKNIRKKMERQIYRNDKERIEAYITSGSGMVMSSVHPISKFQIIVVPEAKLQRGKKSEEEELRNEINLLLNREERTKAILDDIIKEVKSYIYSFAF